jgi:hypothetical protein
MIPHHAVQFIFQHNTAQTHVNSMRLMTEI